MILIAGTGRDSGKTTLACGIIRKFTGIVPLIALKISPHSHRISNTGRVIIDDRQFFIAEETDTGSGKDSSRMLAAGASRSYFIMAPDENLPLALERIPGVLDGKSFLVCESGGLRKWIAPGIFFVMTRNGMENRGDMTRFSSFPAIEVVFDGHGTDLDMNRIIISGNSWKLSDPL
jgi:hypothetical protein